MLGLTLLAAVVAIPGLLFRQVTAQTTDASCTNNEYNWVRALALYDLVPSADSQI